MARTIFPTSRTGSGPRRQPPPRIQRASLLTSNTSARQPSAWAAAASNNATTNDKERRKCNCFKTFTAVLLNYLEQCDPAMHTKAMAQINNYYKNNKAGDPSLKDQLRATVGETYWRIAVDNVNLLQQHEKPRQSILAERGKTIAQLKASKDQELALKDNEIGQLKESLKRRESELLKQYMTSRPLVEMVDLSNEDEPASKRQCTENVPKKSIAGILLEQTGQKLVKVKEEQVETRAELEDVREDLEDKQDDVDNQVLYTNFLQTKMDELAALAEAAGADKAKVAEIKQRTYRSS